MWQNHDAAVELLQPQFTYEIHHIHPDLPFDVAMVLK